MGPASPRAAARVARPVASGMLHGPLLALAVAFLNACNDCGDFTYRDQTTDEWCGTTYGSQGNWYNAADDSDGEGVYEIRFGKNAPDGNFSFYHQGGVEAYVLVDELEDGLTFTEATPRVLCDWRDIGEPSVEGDEVSYTDIRAEDYELTYDGWRTDLLPGETVRAFSWRITCGPYTLEGSDTIVFEAIDGMHPLYGQLAATGMLDVQVPDDTGALTGR